MRCVTGLAILLALLLCAPGARAEDPPAEPPAPAAEEPTPAEQAPPPEPAAAEDTVILQNGSVWTGRILKEDDKEVVLEHTSRSGGVARYTFPREEIREIKRAEGTERSAAGGPRPVREEWFLLRRGGQIVGTRQLELWSVKSRGEPGFRLEERIEFFAQGPQLPATRTQRTEEVDLRFQARLLAWHEEGDAGEDGAPERYTREVSGRVVDGEWRGSVFSAGQSRIVKIPVPTGARGRLGFREHLLRIARRVRLLDDRILDPDREGMVAVRAGFASVTEDPTGERPGHEFHWEEGGQRRISFFDSGQRVLSEEVSEGIVALPVTREQALAARTGGRAAAEEDGREIRLAEAGIALTPPDAVWTWRAAVGSPAHTGWRVLGRLDNRVLLTDVRIEWHPHTAASEREPAGAEAWLVRRLRSVSPDVAVVEARRPLEGVDGAWRIDLRGTLKDESIRTTAVVVDRAAGRVVLLLAGPAGAWGQLRPAMERLLASIRLL